MQNRRGTACRAPFSMGDASDNLEHMCYNRSVLINQSSGTSSTLGSNYRYFVRTLTIEISVVSHNTPSVSDSGTMTHACWIPPAAGINHILFQVLFDTRIEYFSSSSRTHYFNERASRAIHPHSFIKIEYPEPVQASVTNHRKIIRLAKISHSFLFVLTRLFPQSNRLIFIERD